MNLDLSVPYKNELKTDHKLNANPKNVELLEKILIFG